MTTMVSPAEFVAHFHAIVRAEEKQLDDLWWTSNPGYTEKFLAPPAGIFPQIANGLGFEYRREKARMDAMLYEPINGVRRISVAVEHEHDADKTDHNELWRLSLLNVPLKVLVTYPNYGEQALLLSRYANVIQAADLFQDFDRLRRQLVVFGFSDEPGAPIDWRYYSYSKTGFVPMEVKG